MRGTPARRHPSASAPADREFAIGLDEPGYVIGVVSHLVNIPIWTLRILDREGIVKPKRRVGRARLYSLQDVRVLVQVRHLMMDRGVNIEGIRVILQATIVKA